MSAGALFFHAMRVLALDASTHAGWALLEHQPGDLLPTLLDYGLIENEKGILEYGEYPWCYVKAASLIADSLFLKAQDLQHDVVVIEETNMGRARYTQKILEFIHCRLLSLIEPIPTKRVVYVNSSDWRKTLGIKLATAQKRNNARIAQAKRLARSGKMSLAAAKAKLGVKGRITKKHLAVDYVNSHFKTDFKLKDNDIADAICLGTAFCLGTPLANGII